MSTLMQLLMVVAIGALVWFAVRIIKRHPGAFTKANFEKTATTIGLLTLMIMGVVGLCVWILK